MWYAQTSHNEAVGKVKIAHNKQQIIGQKNRNMIE